MKNKSMILNAALAVAVIVLYILHFSGGSTQPVEVVEEEEVIEDTIVFAEVDSTLYDSTYTPSKALNFPIAYVSIDRINSEYKYIVHGRNRIERKYNNLKKKQAEQEKGLYNEMVEINTQFQGGLLSEQDAQKMTNNLDLRHKRMVKEAQGTEEKLLNEMQSFKNKYESDIREFIDKNKDEFKYSYVLLSGQGSPVLYGNDSLDITDQLLEALNYNYLNKK